MRRSPLGATSSDPVLVAEGDGVVVRERPFLVQLLLRMDPVAAALDAVERQLTVRPPVEPNHLSASPSTDRLAIWLGPDEWLVVGGGEPAELEGLLVEATAPHCGAVVDVSAQRTLLELAGPGVRDVLAAGCPIDLHPRAFPVGAAAQTMLARVDVIVGRGGPDTYHVAVRASFAPYLVDWLRNAMEEPRNDE